MTPIFKKGRKEGPRNYRLVSITSVPAKIMEQILLEIILRYLENTKLIDDSHHGFTKCKSCLPSLVAFCNRVTALLDQGRATDLVYPGYTEHLMLSHATSLSLNWGDMDLMDG